MIRSYVCTNRSRISKLLFSVILSPVIAAGATHITDLY